MKTAKMRLRPKKIVLFGSERCDTGFKLLGHEWIALFCLVYGSSGGCCCS